MISCTWKSSISVYCAILSLSLHLSLILSSVECSKSAAAAAAAAVNHLNRAVFTSWSSYGEKGGGCFYKQYHDVNQTVRPFLVGAFLEKRVDYSPGFSSMFFFRYT